MRRGAAWLLMVLLCLVGWARADGFEGVPDGENRLTGEAVVGGYAFAIDAVLEDARPAAGFVTYRVGAYDRPVWEEALREWFPGNAEEMIARMERSGTEVWTDEDFAVAYGAPVLPASENVPDEWLSARQEQCVSFLKAVGVACDPEPFSAAYTVPRTRSSLDLYMDASDRDKATGARLTFLLTDGQMPVAIGGELLPRHNGSFGGWGRELICRCPTAQFAFDMEGNLLDFHIACLEMTASGEPAKDFLTWEEALTLMLQDFVASEVIQRNLAQFSYTVTGIRCAWDLDAREQGRPGWMISLSAKSADETSPTGWVNRFYTGFVYGER